MRKNTKLRATALLILSKDDNIHKSEALKGYGRRTLTLVECRTELSKYISFDNIVRKFVLKLLKYIHNTI